ncbi:ABC transporter permease [Mycoplasma marinum]|uniref:Uncharacterized protein n=1 Tax=Mycoplasma marinum TaxID=1937190 RepID=A0A4R0XWK8_9MOLU|nr:ABC transporter permease [Mycoplasma marinum]TCG11371.1 hypothetical protein C4B24_02360 [Mycoplasma marinum]
MFKYMRLQLFLISKKLSTYLVPIIFMGISVLIIGLPILLIKAPSEMLSGSLTNPLSLILPFIVSAIFVATKALNIFKEPEENGSELLIVSKPITRIKIVFGKFFTLYILIFLFAIMSFFTGIIIGLFDAKANSKDIFEFSMSYAIGTFIVQMLLSSMIVFFSSLLGKVGTMVISIFLPVVLTILSLIMIPLSNASLLIESGNSQNRLALQKNGKIEKKTAIFQNVGGTNYEDHVNSWYKTAAYFDVWTQLSSFYSIAQTKNTKKSMLLSWRTSEKFNDKNILWFPEGQNSSKLIISGQQFDQKDPMSLNDIKNDIDSIYNNSNFINHMINWIKTETKINNINKYGENSLEFSDIKSELKDYIYTNTKFADDSNRIAGDFGTAYMLSKLTKEPEYKTFGTSGTNELTINVDDILKNGSVIKNYNYDNSKVLIGSPYISKAAIYGIWLIILFGVSGLVILRFVRRDFK